MRLLITLLVLAMLGVGLWFLLPLSGGSLIDVDPPYETTHPYIPPPTTVHVKAVTNTGALVHGRIKMRSGPDPRALYVEMGPGPDGDTGDPFPGEVRFDVPTNQHTWIQVAATDGSVAIAHVRPNAYGVTVKMGNAPSTVYAMVFGPDWRTPVSGAMVQATFTPDAGGAQQDLGTLTAAGDGVLMIEGLEAGSVVLRPHGFRPGDGPPFVGNVTVGNKGKRRDAVATLVMSGPRREVKIDALVQQDPAASAWLVVKRVDRPDGVLLWSGEALHEGAQKIVLTVAEGEWQPAVVPVGELTITGGEGLLSVRGPGPHTFNMHFAPCATRAELTMTGVAERHLPLRVMALPVDGMREDDPDRYLGQPQWPAVRASVPALPGAVWLAAQGRAANYVSTGSCTLQGNVIVAMQEACWLTVERGEWDPAAKPEVLTVDCGANSWAAPMRPRLVQAAAGKRIVLAVDLALPFGKAVVQGQEVKLEKPAQVLRLH